MPTSNKIVFTPLSGAHNEEPLCYLLQMDNITILLDCGWDDHFNINDSHIRELERIAETIDIILLSHSDVHHVGALPYLAGRRGLFKKAKIFGTLPLVKMGQMTLYDLYNKYETDFDVYDLDNVDAVFDQITQLKYSQRYVFNNEKTLITIAAYNAGRTLGGTIWKITKEMDEIVYAVDYNDKRERHLNATVLESLGRPSILITDAYNAQATNMYRTKQKADAAIVDLVINTLRNGGNVLLPVDCAQRSLELSLVLESKWKADRNLRSYPLIFLSTMAYRTVEFASHQLEWMSDNVMKGFDERRENPFDYRHIRCCHSLKEVEETLLKATTSTISNCVILATTSSLETGFARELLVKYSSDPNNTIILTERGTTNSLSRKLVDHHLTNPGKPFTLPLTIHKRVELVGKELHDYQQAKLKEAQIKREEERYMQIRDVDEQMEEDGEMMFVDTLRLPHDADDEYGDKNELNEIKRHVRETTKRKNRLLLLESGVDMSGGKLASGVESHNRLFLPDNMRYFSSHLMFPCIEKMYEYDEYGEKVDVNELKNRSLQLYEEEMNRLNEGDKNKLQQQTQGEVAPEEVEEIPTKSVSENIVLNLLCSLEYINFEGRADSLSVRNILRQVNPRKVVVVHGDKNATKDLQTFCIDHKISETIEAPASQQTIDVTIDTNMFVVRLEPSLLRSGEMIQQGSYELMYVEGQYLLPEHVARMRHGVSDEQLLDEDEDMKEEDMPSIIATRTGHDSVLVGDVKLNQFHDVLVRNGFKPEFRAGGSLVCGANENIMLKRNADTGMIVVEGAVSLEYFKVRRLLYEMYKFI